MTLYKAGLINLYRIDGTFSGDITASLMAIIIFIGTVIAPFGFGLLVIFRRNQKITEEYFEQHLSSINCDLRKGTIWQELWSVIGILRWGLSLSILVLLKDYPGVQILILFYTSLLYQGLLITFKPNEEPKANNLSLFNEILLSVTLLHLLMASDLNDSYDIKEYSGLGLLLILALSVIVNIGTFLLEVLKLMYRKIRYKLMLMKHKAKMNKNKTLAIKPIPL